MPIFHDNDPFSVKKLNDIIDHAVGEGISFMKLSNEGDRQHVVQAVLNNFGSFEGFIERLKELQSIYCGNLKPKASTPSIVFQQRPAVTAVRDHLMEIFTSMAKLYLFCFYLKGIEVTEAVGG